ncbi:hypothetical protein A8709_02455 [Paenibacillus pectinilyticus]|uniref:DUF2620 domain-containing protein n=1 Tax=Paenibacillus pectinilyticus TaxID=512399 RepID=A0A1C1A6X0_9BACL|nr:DUF2620 family protein [Paenibacillus pectinilyticus]OCT16313.1 hypothetical protein A8709_02455 [Paenibacillus pectinilyticus]
MIRIVIAGLQKDRIAKCVVAAGGDRVEATVTTDMDGAKKVKNGQADYYIGACNSGGGAALSIAIGLLGYGRCATVAKSGSKPDAQNIEALVSKGTIAFGIAEESIETAVAFIMDSLLKKHAT